MTITTELHTLAIRKEKKKKRLRYVVLICLCLFIVFTYLESRVFHLGVVPFPVSGNVLVFALININVILLLIMVFLVLRNLVELVFERRRNIIGTKLRTKLVISFVSLSLIPTTLLFFIALQFVSTSMDYWFNINVDRSLEESLNLAQDVYHGISVQVSDKGERIADLLSKQGNSNSLLKDQLSTYELTGLAIYGEDRKMVVSLMKNEVDTYELPEIPVDLLRKSLVGEEKITASQAVVAGELVRGLTSYTIDKTQEKYILVTSRLIPRDRLERMEVISKGIEGYRQLLILKKPIKTSLLVMLLIVTLLIIFCAIWFGFYVAGGLTRPMDKLAIGIQKVAGGELDFVLEKDSGDEMGMLVDSFNIMTKDLLTSKVQIEEAHHELQTVNLETERRRRYNEIILQNVTTGVISLDAEGRIITINKFAADLLKINKHDIVNKDYKTILRFNHLTILEDFFIDLSRSGKTSIQRPLKITVNNETLSLRVNFTKLMDDDQNPLGIVIVFDNLTELEKVQRMAAWREVARRIAHEVKNPLTPIKLSAQRLRKRYSEKLTEEGAIFEQCTATIINQVDELKRLVSEFSSFARMPAVKKTYNHVPAMAREIIFLYSEAHKDIDFKLIAQEVSGFAFDVEQMRRVLVNLLDNAVAALGNEGAVEVEIYQKEFENSVFIEVRDNGPGVDDADKLKLFEPYFSTKKSGTGLGLAIASTVISDHGGYLRVKDNQPTGARFIIELPLAPESLN